LEALWPELEPDSAANSLNQTVYFLRRHIDPWYEEDVSVDYVHARGDVLWLDPEMTTVDSAEFERRATAVLRENESSAEAHLDSLRLYTGRFLPEFEYEEWAESWRDRLHALYLNLVQEAHSILAKERRFALGIEVAQNALAIDPDAVDIERTLVAFHASMGARAAAAELYAHYAATYKEQLGLDPPRFADVVATGFNSDRTS
jgi:two-component SAPR family response regulator